jgi:hypothetical protein
MHRPTLVLSISVPLAFSAAPVLAAVTISSSATSNMSCSGGICAPTDKKAVLNVGDLEGFLASGNVTVTTTGSGVQANDIHVSSALGWANSSTLSLEANRSIAINSAVSITGLSGLTVDTGKNGALSFGKKGNVTFANLSSQLTINGSAFTLAGDIKTLASDIATSPGGNFALANNYNASGDGTYPAPPIGVFTGTVEGLGNAISNFSIDGVTLTNDEGLTGEALEGLFAEVGTNGLVENIGLVNANVVCSFSGRHKLVLVASLVALNYGTVHTSDATGAVRGQKPGLYLGGLVGSNLGTISDSHAGVAVSGKNGGRGGGIVDLNQGTVSESYATGSVSGVFVGGLVDQNFGTVSGSYATGDVQVLNFPNQPTNGGGLVSVSSGTIINSYATGAVSGVDESTVGGLVGINADTISFSYSSGAVTGGAGSTVGGLIGEDAAPAGSLDDTYWDTDTSGITNLSQGAGNIANDPGITGLTTAQFQSGLPAGFDPAVWVENPSINGGLPYLLANPPPK